MCQALRASTLPNPFALKVLKLNPQQSGLSRHLKVVSPGIDLPYDLVYPPDLDPHFLRCSNCACHLQNDIFVDMQDVKSFELPHTLVDLLENELLNGSPIKRKPLKDISLCSENTIIEELLLLGDLGDIFEERMIPALKRGLS